jgi:hypothetical protein
VDRKTTPYDVARATAFVDVAPTERPVGGVRSRVRPVACLVLATMPGALGALALFGAFTRTGTSDGAFPLAVASLLIAALLLVLGLRSRLSADRELIWVRFFGLRGTAVRFDDLVSATFGMTFPSISFGVTLKDHHGKRVVVHANWWRDEPAVVAFVAQRLLERDVPMDRDTAALVARALGVRRPEVRIVHRPLLRRDRPR